MTYPLFAFVRLEDILIPIAALMLPVLIVFTVGYYRNQRRRMWHETARLAIEKGQPLPPHLEEMDTASYSGGGKSHKGNDLRSGLILLGVGAGLYFGFLETGKSGFNVGASITGFIGIALLVNALITALTSRKSSETEPKLRPPQS